MPDSRFIDNPLIYLDFDPDGVLSARRGTLAIDTTTGIRWVNRNGSTRWDPEYIPPERGLRVFWDCERNSSSGTSGTGVADTGGSDTLRIGLGRMIVAAANDVARLTDGNGTTLPLGIGRAVFRAQLKLPNLSDGTDNYAFRIGSADWSTNEPTDGIYLEYNYATHGDHNWRLCAAQAGVRTRTDTGILAVANTWTSIELRCNADGTSLSAEIDGVAVATPVTTNIPVGANYVGPASAIAIKQLGAGSRTIYLDWTLFYTVLTTARGL